MYLEISQGSKKQIQGLECNIPPVGYIFDIATKKVEHIGIYSRSEDIEEQYWERIPMPTWYDAVLKEEEQYNKRKKDSDEDFYDENYENYKRQEWQRRLSGFWFMNKGEPVYLVGAHYLYMQHIQIDIGYPKYRIPDLEYFYFLQYVIQDPNCLGMLEITKRRFGKTFRGGVFVLDYPTRTKMTNGAIQSKTGSDAKKVFAKAVVDPFKKLPRFFKPEYDLSGGVTPKSELRFQNTNVRGKKAEENLEKDELGSLIDYGSADTLAYDGQKIHRKLDDEFAKTLECNIYDRHDVTRYCLMDDEGKIIGKVLYTSTVERLDTDREGVQDGARKLWNDSDQLHKGENGRTPTGLYRFFMAADRAKNFDKYGFSDIEKTRKEILADRKTVEHNPRALSARTRKEPLTIEEAFGIDSDECSFNVVNITKQRAEIGENKCPLRKVMFYKIGEEVTWKDDKNGLWEILEFPKDGKENEHNYTNKFKQPVNTKDYLISIDSYSGYQGGRKYGSTACGLVFDRNKRKFVAMYYGRPQYKEQLHEQIMLASEFYSCKNFYEKTADDYEGYFRTRYMSNYMGRYPLSSIDPSKRDDTERLYGFPITPYAMTKQLDEMILYIEHECNKIWFDKILEQCLLFDPYDRTKSDCVVSAMIAIVSTMEIVKTYSNTKDPLIQSYGMQGVSYGNPALADF